jgi:formyl-CoA transferase
VCEVAGTPDLVEDPRFRTTAERAANQDELEPLLESRFTEADTETWLARFREAGVPSAPLNRYEEVLADPQVTAYGWVQEMQLGNGAEIRTFGVPVAMSGLDFSLRRPAPELDADRAEIVEWLEAGHRIRP